MASEIDEYIDDILNARYGEEVRGSIVRALLWNYDQVSQYASQAGDAKDAAVAAKTSAETASTNAQTAATAALAAKTDAETARGYAETANTNAQSAKTTTYGYKQDVEAAIATISGSAINVCVDNDTLVINTVEVTPSS